jgi:Rieske Fe-S protein
MGCELVRKAEAPAALPAVAAVLTCPCHFSSFALLLMGLTVAGPATDGLAQRAITGTAANLQLGDWLRDRSVPYGVPFRAQSPDGTV